MKRQNEKPYSRRFMFPVFVPGKKGAPSDVPGNFLRRPEGKQGGWSTPWVHPVSANDLNQDTLKRVLSQSDVDLICGALDLRRGMREKNRQLVRGAYEKLMPLIMGWADADESVKDFFARGPWAIH